MLKARAIIGKYKAHCSAFHRRSAPAGDALAHVAQDLEKLRNLVDRELDRRLDADLVDNVCDLLEHLSDYLHAEAGTSREASNDVDGESALEQRPRPPGPNSDAKQPSNGK